MAYMGQNLGSKISSRKMSIFALSFPLDCGDSWKIQREIYKICGQVYKNFLSQKVLTWGDEHLVL